MGKRKQERKWGRGREGEEGGGGGRGGGGSPAIRNKVMIKSSLLTLQRGWIDATW